MCKLRWWLRQKRGRHSDTANSGSITHHGISHFERTRFSVLTLRPSFIFQWPPQNPPPPNRALQKPSLAPMPPSRTRFVPPNHPDRFLTALQSRASLWNCDYRTWSLRKVSISACHSAPLRPDISYSYQRCGSNVVGTSGNGQDGTTAICISRRDILSDVSSDPNLQGRSHCHQRWRYHLEKRAGSPPRSKNGRSFSVASQT